MKAWTGEMIETTITEVAYLTARAMIDRDPSSVSNELKGKVQQYEALHDPQTWLSAYIGKSKNPGMYPVITWTGDRLGIAFCTNSWEFGGIRMHQFYAWIADRHYTGRGQGEGMHIYLKETADSKKSRSLK